MADIISPSIDVVTSQATHPFDNPPTPIIAMLKHWQRHLLDVDILHNATQATVSKGNRRWLGVIQLPTLVNGGPYPHPGQSESVKIVYLESFRRFRWYCKWHAEVHGVSPVLRNFRICSVCLATAPLWIDPTYSVPTLSTFTPSFFNLVARANSNSSVSILDGFERQVTAAAVRSPLRSIRHTHVLPDLVVKFTAKSQFSH